MLELQYYQKIYEIIIQRISINKDNYNIVHDLPQIPKKLEIDDIDRETKDLIDKINKEYGLYNFMLELRKLKSTIEAIDTDSLYLVKVAIDEFVKKIKGYYEIIMYPFAYKWVMRLKNGSFSETEFLNDISNIGLRENELLVECPQYEQTSLFENETTYVLADLSYFVSKKSSVKNSVMEDVRSNVARDELIKYSTILRTTIINSNNADYGLFLEMLTKALNAIYLYRPKASNVKMRDNISRQRRIQGF